MKHEKEIIVPSSRKTVVDYYTCDCCGNRIDKSPSNYETDEVTIERTEGWSYPDTGEMTTTKVDLCSTCFSTHLLPLLEGIGVVPRVEESSW